MGGTLRVAGLDIASVNSGFVIVEASARRGKGRPPLNCAVLHQQAVTNEPGFTGRVKSAKMIADKIIEVGVDMVALEECVPIGGHNTTGLQQSAFLEMTMMLLYDADIPMMLIPPTTMRSFISASTGKQSKKSIMDNTYERYEFRAQHSRQGERSNITDAYVHAYVGACVLFGREGRLTSNLLPAEKNVVYGNAKKMIGLLDRKHIYIQRDKN